MVQTLHAIQAGNEDMGKLKIKRECGNFPLPPNQIRINIELVADVMKFITPDGITISIQGNDKYERNRNQTKICAAIDYLMQNLKMEKKNDNNS